MSYRHLTFADRNKLEALTKAGHTPKYIAAYLCCHVSTIYRELRRGAYDHMNTDLILVRSYSADIAQHDYDYKQTSKGAALKIGNDYGLMSYIEDMILSQKYSPDAVIGRIHQQRLIFNTDICTRTLYNYINSGLFLNLTNKDLPMRGKCKKSYRHIRSERVKMPLAKSIEQRPDEANLRDWGHWELDTVVGKVASKSCLLVLTERSTRHEIVRKLRSKTQSEVVHALDQLEHIYKDRFPIIFKTITSDNGTEFLNTDCIEQSCIYKSVARTHLYYCHPYSAYERGSNENANKLIRRHIPKGDDISKYTIKQVQHIESWINNYPRKILGYRTSAEVFAEHLNSI